MLKGFKIGDEGVQDVIRPAKVGSTCVACHSSTPDGKYVGFISRDAPETVGGLLNDRFDLRAIDGSLSKPSFLTPAAQKLLGRHTQEAPVFSKAHWSNGDHIALSVYIPIRNDRSDIIWTDLEATTDAEGIGWGVLARGDLQAPALPQFSHDGNTVAYFTGPIVTDGSTAPSGSDVFTVPYNNRKGGIAARLPGASDPALSEFFPTFSPDDKYLAFNRVGAIETSYTNSKSEVFVIPSAGGIATRLKANDPPACLGRASPGLMNSWSRWAPEVKSTGGRDYYFLVFSSTRNAASAGPQLYVAPVIVSGTVITSYPALYLWNQPELEHNHTPAWDVIKLPPPK
ncbi:MAG: hypothetical protein NVS3B20_26530 [Polyangiales bacterium]